MPFVGSINSVVRQVLDRLGLTYSGAAPAPGSSGTVLTSNGAGVAPTYQAASGGSQTPWTADVDAAGYNLTGAGQVEGTPANSPGAPAFTFAGDNDTGVYRSAANEVAVSAAGAPVAKFSATGFSSRVSAIQKTADWSLASTDCRGQVYLVNGSGMVTATLPAAATAGDHCTFIFWGPTSRSLKVVKAASGLGGGPLTLEGFAPCNYVHTNRTASRLDVVFNDDGEWDCSATGTWRAASTTGAGFAFTSTGWISYTPATPFQTGTGTGYSAVGYYRHVGSTVEQTAEWRFTGAADGTYLVLVPAVGTVDATVAGTTDVLPIGTWCYVTNGGAFSYGPAALDSTATIVGMSNASGAAFALWQRAVTATPANACVMTMRVAYPVAQ